MRINHSGEWTYENKLLILFVYFVCFVVQLLFPGLLCYASIVYPTTAT